MRSLVRFQLAPLVTFPPGFFDRADSGSDGGGGDVVTPGIVFGGAAVIGAINIVLMTALCTVGTFIYNLCSDLVGGLELTLSERD